MPRYRLISLGCLIFLLLCSTQGGLAKVWAQGIDNAKNSDTGAQFLSFPKKPSIPKVPKPKAPSKPLKSPKSNPPPVPNQAALAAVRAPLVIFLLDASSSMATKDPKESTTRIWQAHQAIVHALQNMPSQSWVQVRVFNNHLRGVRAKAGLKAGFVSLNQAGVREGFADNLGQVEPYGTTHLYRAVVKTLTQFNTPKIRWLVKTGRRYAVLLVISDGQDSGKTKENLASVQAAKQQAEHVVVHVIGFRALEQTAWFREVCAIASSPKHCSAAKGEAALRQLLNRLHRYVE